MPRPVHVYKSSDGYFWLDREGAERMMLLPDDGASPVDRWLADHGCSRDDLTFDSPEIKAEFEQRHGAV